MKRISIYALLFISLLSFSGLGCRTKDVTKTETVSIKIWGVFDNPNEISPVIKAYQNKNRNVKISYEKKSFNEYENILLNGLSDGTGPDVFVMHNTWLPKYMKKITPIADTMMTLQSFRDTFTPVTEDDLVDSGKIYALPLYVDTLAMYYNFDHYRVTKDGKPSATWEEFTEDISRLNVFNQNNQVMNRSAVALGTENNVNQAVDVLFQLFLQNGVSFYNKMGDKTAFGGQKGLEMFEQYLSYSDPLSPNYSWQAERKDDIYEFVNGTVSTIVGYSYLYNQIAAQSRIKGLDFRIANIPQINPADPVTYADYWAYTVRKMDETKDKTKIFHAWSFIKALTAEDSARTYFELTKRPSAIKKLLEEEEKDPDFGVFPNQVRYARSIKNYDRDKYNDIFEEAIKKARLKEESPGVVLGQAAEKIDEIVQAYKY